MSGEGPGIPGGAGHHACGQCPLSRRGSAAGSQSAARQGRLMRSSRRWSTWWWMSSRLTRYSTSSARQSAEPTGHRVHDRTELRNAAAGAPNGARWVRRESSHHLDATQTWISARPRLSVGMPHKPKARLFHKDQSWQDAHPAPAWPGMCWKRRESGAVRNTAGDITAVGLSTATLQLTP